MVVDLKLGDSTALEIAKFDSKEFELPCLVTTTVYVLCTISSGAVTVTLILLLPTVNGIRSDASPDTPTTLFVTILEYSSDAVGMTLILLTVLVTVTT